MHTSSPKATTPRLRTSMTKATTRTAAIPPTRPRNSIRATKTNTSSSSTATASSSPHMVITSNKAMANSQHTATSSRASTASPAHLEVLLMASAA